MNDVTPPFIAELAIIFYRDMVNGVRVTGVGTATSSKGVNNPGGGELSTTYKGPPLPSEIAAACIIFGGASFLPERWRQLFCWGIVIATLLSSNVASGITGQSAKPTGTTNSGAGSIDEQVGAAGVSTSNQSTQG